MELKRIVVGYDGTAPAERALRRAVELAQAFGSSVIVADVVPPEPSSAVPGAFELSAYSYGLSEPDVQTDEALWEQHRTKIEAVLSEANVPGEFAGAFGPPASKIVEIADEHHADLIVVGTREAGFIERLVGGSVSQGVSRRAHCDVLVVHPGEAEAEAR